MKIEQIKVENKSIKMETKDGFFEIFAMNPGIIRCVYSKQEKCINQSLIIEKEVYEQCIPMSVTEDESNYIVETAKIRLRVHKENAAFSWYQKETDSLYVQEMGKELEQIPVLRYSLNGEKPMIKRVKTVDGERNFVENLIESIDRMAYRAKLRFRWAQEEALYGLGQGEEGIYNYRGHVQYLYQHNMRIPMPMLLSSKGYAVLMDCCSLMTFQDDENGSYLYMDTVDQLDYYFIAGPKFDDIIDSYRYLTGKASMLPKWAFGYIQSKEAYHTQEELLQTAAEYRKRQIPLDGIVQDWNTWESGKWGEKELDQSRYGDMRHVNQSLHEMNVHTMVSVWPTMNEGTKNHGEFAEAGLLLGDYATYDAFSEKARGIYWKQAKEGLFDQGFDSWWCDSTEPFTGPDWGGAMKREPWERFMLVGKEHKKYLDAANANAFALVHAKGIYDNQRKTTNQKRVLNLTRSGYPASQKYGTVLWSGDISASYETLKKQIVEGINISMCGIPYWTLDIGAFFTVGSAWWNRGCGNHENPNPIWFWTGQYNEGVKDKGYCELYTRWFEYGTFLPMQRSHGTDTPREIWNFGEKGSIFYDAIEKYIQLRYLLMPYIYSLAGSVTLHNDTILRSLMFDFAEDKNVWELGCEYMFGPCFLVCPVTKPMYYEADNRQIEVEKQWDCYLPVGADWYFYWDNERYQGGKHVSVMAGIDILPLFVKAGSIVITEEGKQYATQQTENPMKVQIYSGTDAVFELYEDAGDGYDYEAGNYTTILFTWFEEKKILKIGRRSGFFQEMQPERQFTIQIIGQTRCQTISYVGEELRLDWN
ncbi:MAG: glycoside hydrolase family 31 protein [Lachnospiraceae bacterium]